MSDEKAFEAACFTDLGEVYEKKAQIFGHGDVSVVQQEDGKNMMSYLTSKEQFAQLLKIPHKEMLTAETKNQSVMYQDHVKGDSRLLYVSSILLISIKKVKKKKKVYFSHVL